MNLGLQQHSVQACSRTRYSKNCTVQSTTLIHKIHRVGRRREGATSLSPNRIQALHALLVLSLAKCTFRSTLKQTVYLGYSFLSECPYPVAYGVPLKRPRLAHTIRTLEDFRTVYIKSSQCVGEGTGVSVSVLLRCLPARRLHPSRGRRAGVVIRSRVVYTKGDRYTSLPVSDYVYCNARVSRLP